MFLPNSQFTFGGDPVSQAAAAKAQAAHMAAMGQMGAANYGAQGQIGAAQANAQGQRDATLFQQPAFFGKNAVDLFDAYGKNAAQAYGAYNNPYSQASQAAMGAYGSLGNALTGLYGKGMDAYGSMGTAGLNALGGAGQSAAVANGQIGAANQNALGGLSQNANSAYANVFGNAAQGQALENQARANATGAIGSAGLSSLGQMGGILGSSNQNALAELGASRNAALANQAIAAANGLGQLGVANYNMQGQLGTAMAQSAAATAAAQAQVAAAQQMAGPQYAKLQYLSSAMPSILDTIKYGFQTVPYGAGNLGSFSGSMTSGGGGGAGGANGFRVSGPNGIISEGTYGGGGGSGGSGGTNVAMSWNRGRSGPFTPPPAFTPTGPIPMPNLQPPALPDMMGGLNTTGGFLRDVLASNNDPSSQANLIRGDMSRAFDANRAATMDNSVLNSLNNNFAAGSLGFTGAMRGALDTSLAAAQANRGNYDTGAAFGAIGSNTDKGIGALQSGLGTATAANAGILDQLTRSVGSTMGSAGDYIADGVTSGRNALSGMADRTGATFDNYRNDANARYGDLAGGMSGRYDTAARGLDDLWNKSLGQNDMFMSPLQRAQRKAEAEDFNRQRSDELYASGNDPRSVAARQADMDRRNTEARAAALRAEWAAANPPMTAQERRTAARRRVEFLRRQYGFMV